MLSSFTALQDFVIAANYRIKESEKWDKYFDIAQNLKKNVLWNMKVTTKTNEYGVLWMNPKGLLETKEEFETGGRVENIQTTALLRSAGVLRRVLVNWGNFFRLQRRANKRNSENVYYIHWIIFPANSCLWLYSFCASLPHALIM